MKAQYDCRLSNIQCGLDIHHNKRMANIIRGLEERESEREAAERAAAKDTDHDVGGDKGKNVDRGRASQRPPSPGPSSLPNPFIVHRTAPIPRGVNTNPPSSCSTPFPTPNFSREELMDVDHAERASPTLGPRSKRTRTEFEQEGDKPAVFLEIPPELDTANNQTAHNVVNSFPHLDTRQPARRIVNNFYERLAMLQSAQNIASDPRLHLTPPPVGKYFPTIEGLGPMWLQEGIPDWVIEAWDDIKDQKCLLQIFSMSADESHERHNAAMDQLPKLINDIFETKTIVLARPGKDKSSKTEPNTFFLTGMPIEVLEVLIAYRSFSTTQWQFQIHPYESYFPDFLCTLENFSPSFLINVPNLADEILKIIRRTLLSEPAIEVIANIIEAENQSALEAGEEVPPLTLIMVLDSVRITIQEEHLGGGIAKPIVNIYSPSPFTRPVLWSAWRDIFLRTEFRDTLAGTGKHITNRYCTGCHGVNHTSGLCPFPKIPGWHNHTPPTNNPNNKQNAPKGGQRGKKPQGKGKGWGKRPYNN